MEEKGVAAFWTFFESAILLHKYAIVYLFILASLYDMLLCLLLDLCQLYNLHTNGYIHFLHNCNDPKQVI